jgi:hypothetical protein
MDARAIYISSLRNTHALEQQGLQQLEIQVSRLVQIPLKPDAYSKVKPDTCSSFIPVSVPM